MVVPMETHPPNLQKKTFFYNRQKTTTVKPLINESDGSLKKNR